MVNQMGTSGNIDRTIGLLFSGLVILAFLMLSVAGMNSVRRSAEDVAGRDSEPNAAEVQVDLGQ